MELANVIAILSGVEPTPASRFLSCSGHVDGRSLARLSKALASNVFVRGLRLDGAQLRHCELIAYCSDNPPPPPPFPATMPAGSVTCIAASDMSPGLDAVTGCTIGDTGAILLATALRETGSLDTLELPACGVRERGARALAAALDESNFNLTSLDLRGELHFGRPGPSSFSKALWL